MAIVSVSNQVELKNALNSAEFGDKIVLSAGNYGSLSLNGNSKVEDYTFDGITIASKSSSNPAVFNMVNFNNVTNVTFDGIKFDYNGNSGTNQPFLFNKTDNVSIMNSKIDGMMSNGYGTGQGLWIKDSSDFRVQNTDFVNFLKTLWAGGSDDLQVIGNSFSGVGQDAMIFTGIHGAIIQGNSVDINGREDLKHRDTIQFWNGSPGDASHDIVIRDNLLVASEPVTHGIYMANEIARKTGDVDDFYKNITIENNTIKNGQFLGIAVDMAVGVTIRNNTVLQHADIDSTHAVTIPGIYVDRDARQVSITGNTTHKQPEAVEASANWQADGYKPSGWTIANNKLVPLGSTGGASSGGSPAPAPADPGGNDGNGTADSFRFNAGNLKGSERVTFNNVDFSEGDLIKLSYFDAGTFNHYAGDNVVAANADKSYVQINSLTDIQEIVTAAKAVSALFQANDTLVMRITQGAEVLDIALPGLADDYKATFSEALF